MNLNQSFPVLLNDQSNECHLLTVEKYRAGFICSTVLLHKLIIYPPMPTCIQIYTNSYHIQQHIIVHFLLN